MQSRTEELKQLFDHWIDSYPEVERPAFHRDGIVHESTYLSERHHVLFVLLEPNSRDGRFDKYFGWDLRRVLGEEALAKPMTANLARWTRVLLDRHTIFETFDGPTAQEQLRRVAVMNLKKIAGTGIADHAGAAIHAWHDRQFIREQVAIMRPNIAVACGKQVNRIFRCVMNDDRFDRAADGVTWWGSEFTVIPANHPSLRSPNAPAAFERLVDMASAAKLAAFC